jgi:hypothetical protein
MAQFAVYLSAKTDLPVTNLTELPGKSDVYYYSKTLPISGNPAAAPSVGRFDLSSAREQRGLDCTGERAGQSFGN